MEMTLLRELMPPELYKELCVTLQKQGRNIELERETHVPEPTYDRRAAALTGIGTDIAAGERKLLVSTRR